MQWKNSLSIDCELPVANTYVIRCKKKNLIDF